MIIVSFVLVVLATIIGVFSCRVAALLLSMEEELIDLATLTGGVVSALVTVLHAVNLAAADLDASEALESGIAGSIAVGLACAVGVAGTTIAIRMATRLCRRMDSWRASRRKPE